MVELDICLTIKNGYIIRSILEVLEILKVARKKDIYVYAIKRNWTLIIIIFNNYQLDITQRSLYILL